MSLLVNSSADPTGYFVIAARRPQAPRTTRNAIGSSERELRRAAAGSLRGRLARAPERV